MTVIDPTTNLGRLRLRCADFSSIPYLPDSVYLQTLVDQGNDLPRTAKICATYILGMLAFKTHRKMGLQLEVWGREAFESYKEYLLMLVSNPAFMDVSPIAAVSLVSGQRNVLADFVSDWNQNYYYGTQSQSLALNSDISPNDGSREGPLGSLSTLAGGAYSSSGWVFP